MEWLPSKLKALSSTPIPKKKKKKEKRVINLGYGEPDKDLVLDRQALFHLKSGRHVFF
jgi:hypothetical protein